MANERIEAAIEQRLLSLIDQDISPEQMQNEEHKLVTVRKLSEG